MHSPPQWRMYGWAVFLAFIALEGFGQPSINPALFEWTQVFPWPCDASYRLSAVGNDRLVVAGTRFVSTGPDLKWTASDPSWQPNHLLFAFGQFYGFDDNGVYQTSKDGIQWVQKAFSQEPWPTRFVYGNGILVAGNNFSAKYRRSADGVNWTEHTAPGVVDKITFGNGQFLIRGAPTSTSISSSIDGIVWSEVATLSGVQGHLHFAKGRFYLIQGSSLHSSLDGRKWQLEDSFAYPEAHKLAGALVEAGDYVFGLWNGSNIMLKSSDGVNWDAVMLPQSDRSYSTIAYFAGRYFLFGDAGLVLTSKDAAAWEEYDRRFPWFEFSASSLAFHKGRFFATARWYNPSGWNEEGVLESNDLKSWAIVRARRDETGLKVFSLNDRLFLAGHLQSSGVFITEYGAERVKIQFLRPQLEWIFSAAWDGRNYWLTGLWYESVRQDAGYNTLRRGMLFRSSDGLSWEEVAVPGGLEPLVVAAGQGKTVVIGDDKLISSQDGREWTLKTSPNTRYSDVAYGGGTFVVVGSRLNTHVVPEQQPIVEYSSDAVNWVLASKPGARVFSKVAYGGSQFVAVEWSWGELGRAYASSDREEWTPLNTRLPSFLAYGNKMFAAIGRNQLLHSQEFERLLESGRLSISVANGTVEIGLNAPADNKITIQRSRDLQTWVDWLSTNSQAKVTITIDQNRGSEFLRAVPRSF